MEFSRHFRAMFRERDIAEGWVQRTIEQPESVEESPDGTVHYLRRISEHGNRWLRVIVNEHTNPPVAVTVFFDRRLIKRQ